jgi:hypothetical protein
MKHALAILLLEVCFCPDVGLWAQEASASRAINPAGPASTAPSQLQVLHRDAEDTPTCQDRLAEDFVPMSNLQRLMETIKSEVGPGAFLNSAFYAGFGEALDRPKEWGQDLPGYGERLGSNYAEHFIDEAIKNSIAFGLHEDNRYFRSGKIGFGPRLAYALESTVLARHDDGSRSFSVSGMTGAASAAFISRVWQPPSTSSAGHGVISLALILASRTLRNSLREFGPRPIRDLLQ